ncbi:GAF and ANTAR domain-containing protein [Streptomyces sp. JW3]|uniref:GAF and ANTAR domain-containing protein n=1 Tax=Streptomyces sp. JW3 TaxID=3456955 RepID=UPI003FA4B644
MHDHDGNDAEDEAHIGLWRHLAGSGDATADVTLGSACAACASDLGVDCVGVVLISPGELRMLGHATDQRARHLENAQLVGGEGPCTEAFVRGELVEVPDLREVPEDQWSLFTRVADEQRLRAVAAFPLAVGPLRLGALDLFMAAPGPFTERQRDRGRGYARIAALLALDAHPALLTAEDRRARPGPQGYPPSVHLAAGILAEKDGLTPDDALARMRAHAFGNDQPLLRTADQVISDRALD